MTKPKNNIFISDFHFNHYDKEKQRGIITFERTQFDTIEKHDEALIKWCKHYSNKFAEGSTLWFLGDFGDLDYLSVFNIFRKNDIIINFILGNHDKHEDIPLIKKFVDNIYEYPVWLSNKLVISHFPVAVYEDTINIHGHLHGSKLQDINHINASIDVAKWQPITDNHIAGIWAKLPKFNRRFLYEPWAADYQFTKEKEEIIMNYDGCIDLSASRVLQKLNKEQRKNLNDPYNPYTGGLNER